MKPWRVKQTGPDAIFVGSEDEGWLMYAGSGDRPAFDYDNDERDEQLRDGARLAELVEALDGWLRSGGALPAAWVVRL